jgi:hypothetical protein
MRFVLFFVFVAANLAGGEKPWTEVRSPNFRVLTNASANDGRRTAREFEQIRALFAQGFPKMRLDSGARLTIWAPQDEQSMKSLAPSVLKGTFLDFSDGKDKAAANEFNKALAADPQPYLSRFSKAMLSAENSKRQGTKAPFGPPCMA